MQALENLPIEDYTQEGDWEPGWSNEGRTEILYRKKKVFSIENAFNLDLIGHERAARLVCTALNIMQKMEALLEQEIDTSL